MNYYNGKIYLYGGMIDSWTYSNTLWIYTIDSNKWIQQQNKAIQPPFCSGHMTVTYQHYLIMFGGYGKVNAKWICYNDIYIYDCVKNAWNKIECKRKPYPRFDHSMCIVNDNLIIHGGLDVNDKTLKDMHSVSIVNLIKSQNPIWIQVNNDIGPLHSHLMVSNHDKLYCFGGDLLYLKGPESKNNHLLVCDLKYNHYSEAIFGGYGGYSKTQNNREIKQIVSRDGHNGCGIHLKNRDYIFIFGGCGQNYYNDTFLIYIQGRINNNDNNEQKLDNIEQKYNKMCQEYELKIKKIQQENENIVSQLIKTNQTLTTEHQSTMKSMEIEIKSLKQNINDLMTTNQEEATKSKTIKNAYENKIQSLSKQMNNEQKSERKQNDNLFRKKEESFRKYFFKKFDSIKSNKIYYNNLVENDINNFDVFILMESMDDINEYIKPKNKLHGSLILKRINKIKKDRNIFELKLDRINMSDYLDVFDLYGIYTLNEYNNKIKTINDLKNILNNNEASQLIFNSINNNNEGQPLTQQF